MVISTDLFVICLAAHMTVLRYSLFFWAVHLGEEASWEDVCGAVTTVGNLSLNVTYVEATRVGQ